MLYINHFFYSLWNKTHGRI